MEIKFKAYYPDGTPSFQNEQYLPSFLRRFIEGVNYSRGILSEHPSYLPKELEEYLVLYTGFKDSEGGEIYDGDIIKSHHFYDYNDGGKEYFFFHQVEYSKTRGAWIVRNLTGNKQHVNYLSTFIGDAISPRIVGDRESTLSEMEINQGVYNGNKK